MSYDVDAQIKLVLDHLNSILVSGETVECWAIQHRLFALLNRRMLVAATSGRFIMIERKLVSGFKLTAIRWQDLQEVSLNVRIFAADLTLKILSGDDLTANEIVPRQLTVNGFIKEQIQGIYRIAQFQDQAWREKRRVRELEEMRAKSGGINLNNQLENPFAKLKEVKQMLDDKLISDSEYETLKAKILNMV